MSDSKRMMDSTYVVDDKPTKANSSRPLNVTYVMEPKPATKGSKVQILSDEEDDEEIEFSSPEPSPGRKPTHRGPAQILSDTSGDESEDENDEDHTDDENSLAEDVNDEDVNATIDFEEEEDMEVHNKTSSVEDDRDRMSFVESRAEKTSSIEGDHMSFAEEISGDKSPSVTTDTDDEFPSVQATEMMKNTSISSAKKSLAFVEEKRDIMPTLEEVLSSDNDNEKENQVIQIDEVSPQRNKSSVIDEIQLSDGGGNEIIEEVIQIDDFPKPADQMSKTAAKKPVIIPAPNVKPELYNRLVSVEPEKRLFGGKMTEERMDRVKAITQDVISAVHSSLNTAPEEVLTETPKGLRIELLRHQKVGLTWLLWRERQTPPGGILADDMGLGKTLSIISLILQKKNLRLEAERNGEGDATEEKLKRRALQGTKLVSSHATLVIAPASLIYQWDKEVTDRVKNNLLRVYIFHGPKKQRDCSASVLASYDIVITTYQTVASELSEKRVLGLHDSESENESDASSDVNSPFMKRTKKADKKVVSKNSHSVLSKIAWERIVLDEAHQVKNRNSLASRAVCRLPGIYRWCLTGTPIHNELWDLFSLIRFLRVAPFSEEKMWKEFIMASTRNNAERLNTLVKGLLLRRTKDQICTATKRPLVDLKPRKYEIVTLELKELERRCYDIMFAASKQKVQDLLKNQEYAAYGLTTRRHKKPAEVIKNPFLGGSRQINVNDRFQQMSSVLVLLLRLRQACVHMCLTRKGVDMEAFQDAGGDISDKELAEGGPLNVLEQSFANLSLEQANLLAGIDDEKGGAADEEEDGNEDDDEDGGDKLRKRRAKAAAARVERIFEPTFLSTKVHAVLDRLRDVIEAKDKCVIVSQWTSMLEILETHLKQHRIKYTSITGAILTKDRQERVNSFNSEDGGAQVMLLSLTAGGVGLNLVGGNHLFLLDLHWNPALERQACDRIYRMGQRKSVFIHKFLCEGTIEKRVLDLQEKKTALATSVLEGAASKKLSKLTMNDLKFLFELDNRTASSRQPAPPQPTAVSQPTRQQHQVLNAREKRANEAQEDARRLAQLRGENGAGTSSRPLGVPEVIDLTDVHKKAAAAALARNSAATTSGTATAPGVKSAPSKQSLVGSIIDKIDLTHRF